MEEDICTKKSEVQAFYSNRTIFVTGATGFIGMVLIEKLLRSCPDIRKIYLLMREKKGKNMNQRFTDLLNDPLFALMKETCPNYREKLAPIYGDCAQPNLGLTGDDIKLLQREVNIIFHSAATVRFDEPLKRSTAINIRATLDLLRIARRMMNLHVILHLSTAYSNCSTGKIDECLYDPPMDYEKLLNLVDTLNDTLLDQITQELIKPWPNTYTFTKAISEDVIRREGKGLPICILRPSMVINTVNEPVPGWTNNINGPVGAVFGVAIGILHTVLLNKKNSADMVPVDMLINSIIVTAWKEALNRSICVKSTKAIESINEDHNKNEEIVVYNYVSSSRNPLTWQEFVLYNESYDYPSEHCVWYYSCVYPENIWINAILRIFLHYFPALLVDIACIFLLKKPMMLKAYRKIHKFLDLTTYFQMKKWQFSDKNVLHLWSCLKEDDQAIFPFNIEALDWRKAMEPIIRGVRVYFLKDPLETVEKAKIKYRRLKILHYTVVSAVVLLMLRLLWWLISSFL